MLLFYIQRHHFTIFLILLEHIFYSSDALVLIKFQRVFEHYLKNRESSTTQDPLGYYDLGKRIQLCDDVLNAKQFSTKYPPWYKKRTFREPIVNLTRWDLPPGVPIATLNYQRSLSARLGGKDSSALQYKTYNHRMRGITQPIPIKVIQCVRTVTTNWFVTFGLVDGFMYLLEGDDKKANPRLRMTAILEPSPFIDIPGFIYFQSQHEEYRDEMESICLLGFDDHMRLCVAVLDTLDKFGRLAHTISQIAHVKFRHRHCGLKDILMHGKVLREYFLHCDFVSEDGSESSPLFYALADSSERGAVFVFLEGEHGTLESYARMVKVGALVNPVGPKEVRLNAETQSRNEKGKIIKNDNNNNNHNHNNNKFVSWRDLQKLKNKEDRWRYNRAAETTKRRSQSKPKSKRTRMMASSEDETIQTERSRRKRKEKRSVRLEDEFITTSEDESGHPDEHVLQKSGGRTSGNKRLRGCSVKNKDHIERRASKGPEPEGNEYQRDRLEKVSDSSEEKYEQASEDIPQVFEGQSERKDRNLLELQMLVRTFAEHIENDFTNKSEDPPLLTNLPQSWGRRARRS